jgi:hypothetical protein
MLLISQLKFMLEEIHHLLPMLIGELLQELLDSQLIVELLQHPLLQLQLEMDYGVRMHKTLLSPQLET